MSLLQVLTLNFDSCFKVKWGHIFPLLLVLEVGNVKTTDRKSCAANLLQVSNMTFDLCFKVKGGYNTEKALYLPYLCSTGTHGL